MLHPSQKNNIDLSDHNIIYTQMGVTPLKWIHPQHKAVVNIIQETGVHPSRVDACCVGRTDLDRTTAQRTHQSKKNSNASDHNSFYIQMGVPTSSEDTRKMRQC